MAQKEQAHETPSSITARTSEETEDMHVGSEERRDLEVAGAVSTYALQVPSIPVPPGETFYFLAVRHHQALHRGPLACVPFTLFVA